MCLVIWTRNIRMSGMWLNRQHPLIRKSQWEDVSVTLISKNKTVDDVHPLPVRASCLEAGQLDFIHDTYSCLTGLVMQKSSINIINASMPASMRKHRSNLISAL